MHVETSEQLEIYPLNSIYLCVHGPGPQVALCLALDHLYREWCNSINRKSAIRSDIKMKDSLCCTNTYSKSHTPYYLIVNPFSLT